MTEAKVLKRTVLGTTVAAVIAASTVATFPARAQAQPQPSAAVKPANSVSLSVGAGRMVRLDGQMTDLFVANDRIADVQVRSSDQIYIFGKAAGETTVYATDKAGRVLYSANVRVGNNIGSVDELIRLAMPEAQIRSVPMNGAVLLTGTVAAPNDVEEAQRIVQAYVGEGTQVISRLKTATPMQVMLKVKIAEVSRSLAKDIGFNLATVDPTGGFKFGIANGRSPGPVFTPGGELAVGFTSVPDGASLVSKGAGSTLGLAGSLFGLDIFSALDLAQNDGRVVTLAEPTLTALSGETASFLAGGEFPVPAAAGLNGTAIEFKEYGVSLAFTPVVLEGGRISMRVRPEVSELSSEGAIRLNGFSIPSLTTRRTETTVELGSGQSFVIGGLLRNSGNNSVEKAPFLGDIPILGALFRSQSFRRNETELVIVVTPYLVKPVSASQIALPTDGYRTASDPQRILLDQQHRSRSGEQRPKPTIAPPVTVAPGLQPSAQAIPARPVVPAASQRPKPAATRPPQTASATPGFSF
jgi:pilus assembly protein CpaC